jgi:predicted kinase
MVAATRASQTDGDEAAPFVDRARQLLALAHRWLRTAQPRLLLVGGLPGTGKSTLAQGLAADRPDVVLLRSDVVRKELAGLDPLTPAGSAIGTGLYDRATSSRVYAELARRAQIELAHGRTVIVDASFQQVGDRDLLRRAATAAHAPMTELRCVLDEDAAGGRILRRAAEGVDASDATPDVAAAMAVTFEPWPEATEIDTAGSPDDALAATRRAIRA